VTVTPEQRQLRLRRTLLLSAGSGYLVWWGVVHAALPHAFNPLLGRAAVVSTFFAVVGASYAWERVRRSLDDLLALCCCVATAHYFYLFDRNDAAPDWVVGSYITVTAVCAVLQTSRSLLLYSIFTTGMSGAAALRHPSSVVFLPGLLTILAFANVGLASRLRLTGRLNETHERVASLFEAGFDGIAVHENGVVRLVNGAFASLLGYPKEELIGRDIASLFGPEARAATASMVSGQASAPYEADVMRKDGSRLVVEVMGKRHVLDGREMQQVAFRDVTERKRAERALLRANRDLESFSYSVAHDLQAPLRAINGFSQLVVEDHGARLDDAGRALLDRIGAGALRMSSLIDALLGLARLTRQELLREKVDLSQHASAVAQQLKATHPDRAVEVVVQPGVIAEGDPHLLRALLENLIGNAWKFTEKKASARVVFASAVRDGVAVHRVEDDGAGFDMAHAKKLFAPFQRLHGVGEYPGTGIGLATVQRIVDRHGGRVWAEGEVGSGATFYFTLEADPTST